MSVLLSSWPAYSDQFRNCHQYDDEITNAVQTYWGVYQYPKAWKAQIYQESLCNPDAVSPVGARGLAQFMPATWRDMEKRFGVKMSPHEDVAIEIGAYYMAKRMSTWSLKRSEYERWKLGLASYNAGVGNILAAQRACDNERLWDHIKPCLSSITGHHSRETITYVERIETWWKRLARLEPWDMPPEMRLEGVDRIRVEIAKRYDVRRWYNNGSWCTYWRNRMKPGWYSAHHCHAANNGAVPPYVTSNIVWHKPGNLDLVFYGDRLDPPNLQIRSGEVTFMAGYPAGSDHLSIRRGVLYHRRSTGYQDYDTGGWIIKIDGPTTSVGEATYEPAVGGMSGGLVVNDQYEAIGVMITTNALVDLDGDGDLETSLDMIPLTEMRGLRR
jgi:hypothetical protein